MGDSVLALLKGLIGGGGDPGLTEPSPPVQDDPNYKPWEDPGALGGGTLGGQEGITPSAGPPGVGSAAPPTDVPPAIGGPPVGGQQDEISGLIEALQKRNQGLQPYGGTGLP